MDAYPSTLPREGFIEMQKPSIFIAHSTLDTKHGRVIRNLFEDRGHDALLFRLEQDMTQDYLENLIQREIQARDWLVVANSPNAQKSKWVPFEQAYARLREKPIYNVDLLRCPETTEDQELVTCLAPQIAEISRDLRAFLSYSFKDKVIAQQISSALEQVGYELWDDRQIRPMDDWRQVIEDAVRTTLEKGYMVVLLSANSSAYVHQDIDLAQKYQGRIIPCLIEPRIINIPPSLQNIQYVNFTDKPYDHALRQLIQAMR
jgi:hypothetical protein